MAAPVPDAAGPAGNGTAADDAAAEVSAAAPPGEPEAAPAARTRPGWRGWRGRRPFWGGVLVLLGGAEILFTLRAPLPVVLHIGMQGLAGYLVPVVMVICGVLILVNPTQRLFYSVLAVLSSLASWITSNLGGFLIGMIIGVVGACLTFGWLPDQPARRRRFRRKAPGPARA
ncbi:DUF6114 domain-containing protein [Kitasatospora sp. A2-31]|uniref:DUF6114 domain-containing protein n=1 Tax=Kitasatospora sp. A2-31 TaxID=2916414 RepID=UPI001EE9F135|nr:DUF6114 domain-containing protein [Kitasatospora sp. A2-31]MCG6498538.1 DUF6114 domain-containing protein [Kitasatospora sp. A2-31]